MNASEIDAVIIPGGYAPDLMRVNDALVALVRDVFFKNKTVAAICHAGWVLVSAGALEGKTATAVRNVRDDMRNAGCAFVDQAVVVDGNLVTSRVPKDLPVFMKAVIESIEN